MDSSNSNLTKEEKDKDDVVVSYLESSTTIRKQSMQKYGSCIGTHMDEASSHQ